MKKQLILNKTLLKFTRVFTVEDVKAFASLSGDNNPIHIDPEYAISTPFKQNIAHGILVASMFSKILGTQLKGSIYLQQSLSFRKPVFLDEEVTATLMPISFDERRSFLQLESKVTKANGEEAIKGESLVKLTHFDEIEII